MTRTDGKVRTRDGELVEPEDPPAHGCDGGWLDPDPDGRPRPCGICRPAAAPRLHPDEVLAITRPRNALEGRIMRLADAIGSIDVDGLDDATLRRLAVVLAQTVRGVRDIGVPVADVQ